MIRGIDGMHYMGSDWADTLKALGQKAGDATIAIFGKSTPPAQALPAPQPQPQPQEADWLKTVLIVGAVAGAGYLAYRYIKKRR